MPRRKPKAPPPESTSPPVRDLQLCKAVFGAVLSQILFARHAFASWNFQSIRIYDLVSKPFEDLLEWGPALNQYDSELLRDQRTTVFLRSSPRVWHLNNFLGILTTDIFSLLESQDLVKFRISFLRSEKLELDSLLEYFTIVLKYRQTQSYGIDVWAASDATLPISNSQLPLWNLGDYLSRLPPLKAGPTYCTISFQSKGQPEDGLVGPWCFDHSDFADARLHLQQQPKFSFRTVSKITVDPLQNNPHPRQLEAEWTMEEGEAIEPTPGQDLLDLLPPPEFAQTDGYKIHSPSWKRVPLALESRKEKQVSSSQEAKPPTHPANGDFQAVAAETLPQKEEASPLAVTTIPAKKPKAKGRKSSSKDAGKKNSGQKGVSVAEDSEDTPLRRKSKRKAKQALNIIPDGSSSQAEPQHAVQVSQSKPHSANPSKRRRIESNKSASQARPKRRAAPAVYGRLVEGVALTPEPPATSGSAVPDDQTDSSDHGQSVDQAGPGSPKAESQVKKDRSQDSNKALLDLDGEDFSDLEGSDNEQQHAQETLLPGMETESDGDDWEQTRFSWQPQFEGALKISSQ